jgi:hypothetical protein
MSLKEAQSALSFKFRRSFRQLLVRLGFAPWPDVQYFGLHNSGLHVVHSPAPWRMGDSGCYLSPLNEFCRAVADTDVLVVVVVMMV